MNLFLQLIAGIGLLGTLLGSALVGYLFLTQTGGGNWIGGLAVVAGMALYGGIAGFCYLCGSAASWFLRGRGDSLFWRLHGWLLLVVAAGALAVSAAKALQEGLKDRRTRQEQASAQANQALEDSLLSDPAKLKDYVAGHGVDTSLPASSQSPLEAAVGRGYQDLAAQFLAQGARVSDQALNLAAGRGDLGLTRLLLDHARLMDAKTLVAAQRADMDAVKAMVSQSGPPQPTGLDALRTAFTLGRLDLLRLLVSRGVPTNALASEMIWDNKYLRFYPGDAHWQTLLHTWRQASCPKVIQETVQMESNMSNLGPSSFGEQQVLETMNYLLTNYHLCEDPVMPARVRRSPPYDNNSPSIPVVNWGLLRDIHPKGAIPPPYSAKGFSLLKFLAETAMDKKGEGGRVILRQAVAIRNVEVTEMLVKEGYNPGLLKSELSASSFLDVPEDRPMKAYLVSQGFRF